MKKQKVLDQGENGMRCEFLDVTHFVRYFRGEFSETEKEELELHCFACEVCLTKWNKIGKVIKGEKPPTAKELALYLKFFCNPLWDIKQEDIEKRLQQMVKQEICEQLQIVQQKPLKERCIKWDAFDFLRYCQAQMTPIELGTYFMHFSKCNDCWELFQLSIEVLSADQGDSSSDPIPLQSAEKIAILASACASRVNVKNLPAKKNKLRFYAPIILAFLLLFTGAVVYKNYFYKPSSFRFIPKGVEFAELQEVQQLIAELKTDEALKHIAIIKNSDQFANNKLFKAQATYVEGFLLTNYSRLDEAADKLKEAITMEEELNREDLTLHPLMLLSGTYSVMNEDMKAAQVSKRLLILSRKFNDKVYEARALQILALSEWNINNSLSSEELIRESIRLASEGNRSLYAIQGYSFLGIISTDKKDFNQANEYFNKAFELVDKLENASERSFARSTVSGYYARSKALQGEYQQAADFYRQSVASAAEAKINQDLLLSQLHFGLSDCLVALGKLDEGDTELATAKQLESQAEIKCAYSNKFLSFAVTYRPLKTCH